MSIRLALVLMLVAGVSAPVYADKRADAKAHVEFGIKLAKSNLWSEATRQWQKAVNLDDTYAAAWNNLGIGLEQLGKFGEAREAYETALKLDPNNRFISDNYSQFRDIYDRQTRRRDR